MGRMVVVIVVLTFLLPGLATAQAVDWGASEEEIIATYGEPDSILPRFAPPTAHDPVSRDMGEVSLFYFTDDAWVRFVISVKRTEWSPELGLTMVVYGDGRPVLRGGHATTLLQRTERTHPDWYHISPVSLADAPAELIELLGGVDRQLQ